VPAFIRPIKAIRIPDIDNKLRLEIAKVFVDFRFEIAEIFAVRLGNWLAHLGAERLLLRVSFNSVFLELFLDSLLNVRRLTPAPLISGDL
jgi:hypothetical protein